MEFYFPTDTGEQLAYCSAAFTMLLGLIMIFAPGYTYRVLGLQPREGRLGAYAESRSIGGFYLGSGAMATLLAQPMLYLSLGVCFALAAFGRVLSLMSDRGNVIVNLVMFVIQGVLAALPLLFGLGWI